MIITKLFHYASQKQKKELAFDMLLWPSASKLLCIIDYELSSLINHYTIFITIINHRENDW